MANIDIESISNKGKAYYAIQQGTGNILMSGIKQSREDHHIVIGTPYEQRTRWQGFCRDYLTVGRSLSFARRGLASQHLVLSVLPEEETCILRDIFVEIQVNEVQARLNFHERRAKIGKIPLL